MGRELRMVPKNWEHPRKEDGRYQPMFDYNYGEAITQWVKENEQWDNGTHHDLITRPELKEEYPNFAEYHGNPPNIDYYNHYYTKDECTHYQLYETTSEGTPKSPVFETIEEVAAYAEKNCSVFANIYISKDEWLKHFGVGIITHTEGNVTFI